jgi:hypothetical protein
LNAGFACTWLASCVHLACTCDMACVHMVHAHGCRVSHMFVYDVRRSSAVHVAL